MIPTPPPLSATHEVLNQARVLENYNAYACNLPLQEAVRQQGAGWAHDWLLARGAEVGSAEWIEHGRLANVYPPQLKLFDRYGNRRDEVEFHPSWHECLGWLKRNGCDTGPWADPKPGAHVARAAAYVMFAEIEDGSLCPTTMTYGAVPVLKHVPEIAREWMPKMLSRDYDSRFIPAPQKNGVLIGMGLTEKQGGSDVRANTTRAEPMQDGTWRLTGHKWFLSAPMCDAFLVTAQSPKGLSCFFVPRWTPDGRLNEMRIQRFKEKMGDRSNAGTEMEFWGSLGWLVGEEGARHPHRAGDGRLYAARLRDRQHRHHARRAVAGHAPCQPAFRLRQAAEGPAADDERAGRHGARNRSRHRPVDAPGARLRCAGGRVRKPAAILTPAKFWICKRCPTLVAHRPRPSGDPRIRRGWRRRRTDRRRNKALSLYYAVRDGIRYDPYSFSMKREAMRASTDGGSAGVGYCVNEGAGLRRLPARRSASRRDRASPT
jgi:putative acyl-CoA dehydrogenase